MRFGELDAPSEAETNIVGMSNSSGPHKAEGLARTAFFAMAVFVPPEVFVPPAMFELPVSSTESNVELLSFFAVFFFLKISLGMFSSS